MEIQKNLSTYNYYEKKFSCIPIGPAQQQGRSSRSERRALVVLTTFEFIYKASSKELWSSTYCLDIVKYMEYPVIDSCKTVIEILAIYFRSSAHAQTKTNGRETKRERAAHATVRPRQEKKRGEHSFAPPPN